MARIHTVTNEGLLDNRIVTKCCYSH